MYINLQEWTDERLTWNPEEHNGMSEIIIEAKALWKPEFAVINGLVTDWNGERERMRENERE